MQQVILRRKEQCSGKAKPTILNSWSIDTFSIDKIGREGFSEEVQAEMGKTVAMFVFMAFFCGWVIIRHIRERCKKK